MFRHPEIDLWITMIVYQFRHGSQFCNRKVFRSTNPNEEDISFEPIRSFYFLARTQ